MKNNKEVRLLVVFLSLFVLVPSLAIRRVPLLTSAIPDGLTLLIVGIFSGLLLCFASNRHKLYFSPVLGLLAAFGAAVVVSAVFNSYVYAAGWRWQLIFLSLVALLVFAVTDVSVRLGRVVYVRLLASCLWAGVLVYTVVSLLRYYGLLQWALPAFIPSEGRMGGMWAQANLNTTTLWLGMLAALYCCVAPQNKRQVGEHRWWLNWRLVGSVALFGWGIACSASRISWLFAAGLLAMLAVASLPRWRVASIKRFRRHFCGVVVVLVVMFFVVPLLNNPLNQFLTNYGLVNRPDPVSLLERDILHDVHRTTEWEKALLAVPSMSPTELLVGVGPGRYAHFSASHVGLVPATAMNAGLWGNAHNLFVMVFVEEGLLGLAVVLLIVLAIGWRVLRHPMDAETLFLLGSIGLLFIHSNLEYPLWFAWFLALLCLLLLPLFGSAKVSLDSRWLKPAVGSGSLLLTVSLVLTLGVNFWSFATISMKASLSQQDYWTLTAIGKGDSLLSPYATLLKYREFGVNEHRLGPELLEGLRMARWQPRDLVLVREYLLFVAAKQWDTACYVGKNTVWRFPNTAPYMISQAEKRGFVTASSQRKLTECIKSGLAKRGKTLAGVKKAVKADIHAQWQEMTGLNSPL